MAVTPPCSSTSLLTPFAACLSQNGCCLGFLRLLPRPPLLLPPARLCLLRRPLRDHLLCLFRLGSPLFFLPPHLRRSFRRSFELLLALALCRRRPLGRHLRSLGFLLAALRSFYDLVLLSTGLPRLHRAVKRRIQRKSLEGLRLSGRRGEVSPALFSLSNRNVISTEPTAWL
jgi:hypothetical protein